MKDERIIKALSAIGRGCRCGTCFPCQMEAVRKQRNIPAILPA